MIKKTELDEMLNSTLGDRRLSGNEKSALSQALGVAALDPLARAFIRHRAFTLARAEMPSPDAAAVLDWLEGVTKMLASGSTELADESSRASFSPGDDCVAVIASLFRAAQQQVDVCVFTITDDRISGPILDAHRRGIQMRIMTDDEKSHEPGSDVYRFIEAGIPVRMDRSPAHMHHKFAVFDGTILLTGSYNWTRGAAMNNKENLVVTHDVRLVRPFRTTFDNLWNEFA